MPYGEATGTSTSVPAPVGGWNARDSLAAMEPTDAITLDNWIPGTDRVEGRRGYATHSSPTGVTHNIDTLVCYRGGSASSLWAFASDGTDIDVYNVTAAAGTPTANGAFSALAHTGTSAAYQTAMFANTSGYYLTGVDGVNTAWQYNGTTFSTPAITGVTSSTLDSVSVYRFRMFFGEEASLNLWYLPRDAISGTATKYALGGFATDGGSIVAHGTWTVDAGDGTDDMFVVVTSTGQVLLFQGNDPSSASAWRIAGRYKTAPPIGKRCLLRYGSSLFILTTEGIVAVEQLLNQSLAQPATPITDKVRNEFRKAANEWSAEPGWQAIHYPAGRYLLVNIPQSSYASTSTSKPMYQFVMNTQTRAWCRFTGMSARCWETMGDDIYFGGTDGVVYQADNGYVDGATPIAYLAKQAFNYFGERGREKHWTMGQLVLETDSDDVSGDFYIDTDFATGQVTDQTAMTVGAGGSWDTATWDEADWDASAQIVQDWQCFGGLGKCAALVAYVRTNGASLAWYATNWVVRPGGMV
jgi:hypothetical protein